MFMRLAIGAAAICLLTVSPSAQMQCPAVGQAAKEFSLREGFMPDPNTHSVTAGGDIDLGRCAGVPGKGWVTRLPDFVVQYRTNSGGLSNETLTFMIESSADTVLLINDPNERWHFNDDGGGGLNAKISFPRAKPGRYDIWVGSYKRGQLPPARLVITERVPSGPGGRQQVIGGGPGGSQQQLVQGGGSQQRTGGANCPAVGQAAKEFSLAEGFLPDPSTHNVTAGGDLDLGRCAGVPGKGWVTRLPDFVVRYRPANGSQAKGALTFSIESQADTILLINDPNERWYWNDDGGKGLNAKIKFPRAKGGRYDIWVGSLNRGQLPRAKLVITEME
jgi:protease YdgD